MKAPTENGFYWLRRAHAEDTIVAIWDIESGLVKYGAMVAFIGSDMDKSLCDILISDKCKWIGPLKFPE